MKTAYVSVLCGGDGYVPGIEVLGRSLVASGSRVPRVLLATADVTDAARSRLSAQGWQLRDVDAIASPDNDQALFPRFERVFTKLRVWELAEFDRVVLLDADTLVLQNIDELFARSGFAAAPDFFLPDRFNSGVIVLEPSTVLFRAMLDALARSGSYDGGDQGFLNTFFSDWYAMSAEHRLPVGYNMAHFIYQFLRGHPTLRARLERETKVVHYMVQKPWKALATFTGGADAWWQTYFDVHPDEDAAWRDKVHQFEDWTFDKVAAMVLD